MAESTGCFRLDALPAQNKTRYSLENRSLVGHSPAEVVAYKIDAPAKLARFAFAGASLTGDTWPVCRRSFSGGGSEYRLFCTYRGAQLDPWLERHDLRATP